MQIAQDRAKVMAANDVLSHTEPDGTKVYDRLSADAIQLVRGRRDHLLPVRA